MSTHEPTPTDPDGDESMADLFSDLFRLAGQAASAFSQDEVEYRLRRVLWRAGHDGPASNDGEVRARALAAGD